MTAQRGVLLPHEGASPLLTPVPLERAVEAAAVRCVLRWAGDREDDARTVLTALGLLPDVEHKPTVWRANLK